MLNFSVNPRIVLDIDGAWLYVDGVRVCNLDDMTVYDFDTRLSIEGGLVFEVLPASWKPCLKALGIALS